MYNLLFRILNALNPALAYGFAYAYIRNYYRFRDCLLTTSLPADPVNAMGLIFPNPVGLAAGLDRDGSLLKFLRLSAFGFIEIGTININSLHENHDETVTLMKNIRYARRLYDTTKNPRLIGISIGSHEPEIDARIYQDHARAMELLRDYSDFMVINLSRPGSPVRDQKQETCKLDHLFSRITGKENDLAKTGKSKVPLLIKAAIRIDDDGCNQELLTLAVRHGFMGAILAFENRNSMEEIAAYVRRLKTRYESLSLIVVGGIRSADDAGMILDAGASLVQTYGGLVRLGPYQTDNMIRDTASARQAS